MKKQKLTEKDFHLLDSDQKGFIHCKVQDLYKRGGRAEVLRSYRRDDVVSLFAVKELEKIERRETA